MLSLTHRATHATWWSALEITCRYGVQIIVTAVLARLLQPSDFGLVAMLMVFITIAALLAEGGFGSALVQKQLTTANEETSVLLINLCMSLLLAAGLWLLAPSIASFFSQPSLATLMRLLLWMLPLAAVAAVPSALLSQQLNFRKRATAELVASVGSGALALWLAWHGYGVRSLVWQALIGAGLRTLLLWLLSGWYPRGNFDARALGGLLRFGGFLLLANALNLVTTRLQSLLIGRLFDARALGYYSLAQDTSLVPAQFMTGLLNRVGLPMFSVAATQPGKLTGGLRLALRLSMFVFVPCMAGIAIMAKPLVMTLYGAAWAPAATLLGVLALAATFWPLHVLNLAAISALGRSDLVLRLEIAKALTTIPLVLAASAFGAMAVAWAVLAASLVSVRINTWHSRALLGYGFRTQLRDLLPIMLMALLAAAGGWCASTLATSSLARLGIAMAIAVTIYLTGAIAFRMQAWRDLQEVLLSLRSRSLHAGGRT